MKYDLESVPGIGGRNYIAPQFTVDSTGRVYVIVRLIKETKDDVDKTYLVTFSGDGSFSQKISLDFPFFPYALAAFPSGHILVTGTALPLASTAATVQDMKIIVALFDSDGKLIRDLTSPSDQLPDHVPSKPGMFNATIQHGFAEVGPDGYLYLLKAGENPRIEVLSESGEQVRTLKLRSPLENPQVFHLMLLPGRFLTTFQEPRKSPEQKVRVLIGIFDSTTGDPLRFYEPRSPQGSPVCADSEEMTLIVPNQGYFNLRKVRF